MHASPGSLQPHSQSRRRMLGQTACGFGGLAASCLLAEQSRAAAVAARVRARRVIFLFMQGGPSHVDSFDYKPLLVRDNGRTLDVEDDRTIALKGAVQKTQLRLMGPRWKFRQHGTAGLWGSELFPELCGVLDDCVVVRSLRTEGIAHGPATLFLHTGSTIQVRPSIGSWLSYGLGSGNAGLPAFVSITPSSGNGGARNYGSGFLPAIHQGTPLAAGKAALDAEPVKHLHNPLRTAADQERLLELIRGAERLQQAVRPDDAILDAEIASLELAWRMQGELGEVLDDAGETAETRRLYGIDRKETANFGRKCLMARRLAEAGVRFIQVTYGDNTANPAWDQHANIEKHGQHALATDRPCAGLIQDLKRRGLLDDTLVWFGGEFGRTPYAENNGTGRDHNPGGFTMLLAGGGLRSGIAYGSTDELGHRAVEKVVHMHDLHATILHLLGLDHERLTYRFAGRDFRLTDVHGRVIGDILA